MSTTLVKVQHKGAITIPTHLRTQAGISEGDIMEVSLHQGKIILVPKVVIDRSKFPKANNATNDEYTPAQRKVIDARLAKAREDIKRDRVHGPFSTGTAMAASIEASIKKARAAKPKGHRAKVARGVSRVVHPPR